MAASSGCSNYSSFKGGSEQRCYKGRFMGQQHSEHLYMRLALVLALLSGMQAVLSNVKHTVFRSHLCLWATQSGLGFSKVLFAARP